jgi:hypothetical protein
MQRMFFVRSISSDGAISSWSTGTRYLRTKTSASGGTALAAPTNLCLNGDPYSYTGATPGTEYTLSWDPVSGAYGYSIYYSTDRSSWSWAKDATTTSTAVTASANYSTYRYFAVKAKS